MKSVFCGREGELAQLKDLYGIVEGPAPIPQVAVLLAEPGLGKTRLVQEFYHWLSTSREPTDGPGYWPDKLDAVGNTLRVTPAQADCDNGSVMSFCGGVCGCPRSRRACPSVRWPARWMTSSRTSSRCIVPCGFESAQKGGKAAGGAAMDVTVGLVETATGLGVVKTIGVALFQLFQLGCEQINEADTNAPLRETVDRHRLDMTQSLIADLRLVLGGKNARIPAVLLLDDGQFSAGDPGLNHFLGELLGYGCCRALAHPDPGHALGERVASTGA